MLARIIAKTTEMALDALDSAGEQVAGSDHASQDSALAGQPGKSLRERLLLQQLDAAMQSEQYDEARVLQKELNMLSLPSQVGMRMMEHQQRVDMHRNMSVAVPKNNNLLTNVRSIADNALSSWRAISGAELKFVATPVKGGSAGDEGSEEPTPVTRLFRSEGSSTPARGGGAEAANSVPPTPVKDEFQDKMELMHLSLGTSPPDLQAAAQAVAVRHLVLHLLPPARPTPRAQRPERSASRAPAGHWRRAAPCPQTRGHPVRPGPWRVAARGSGRS